MTLQDGPIDKAVLIDIRKIFIVEIKFAVESLMSKGDDLTADTVPTEYIEKKSLQSTSVTVVEKIVERESFGENELRQVYAAQKALIQAWSKLKVLNSANLSPPPSRESSPVRTTKRTSQTSYKEPPAKTPKKAPKKTPKKKAAPEVTPSEVTPSEVTPSEDTLVQEPAQMPSEVTPSEDTLVQEPAQMPSEVTLSEDTPSEDLEELNDKFAADLDSIINDAITDNQDLNTPPNNDVSPLGFM